MGKKSKKLKKKRVSQPNQNLPVDSSNTPISSGSEIELASEETKKVELSRTPAPEFAHVRKDVKRILTLLGIIVVVLIGLYLVDAKSHYLATIANWIYKILNIQAQ